MDDNNSVSVRYGCQSQMKYLYSNKECWRKNITSIEEAIKEYEREDSLSYIDDEKERDKRRKELISQYKEEIIEAEKELEKAEE